MLADVRGDQGDAHRKYNEPPIVDAHGNAEDARDQDLSFKDPFEGHSAGKSYSGENIENCKLKSANLKIKEQGLDARSLWRFRSLLLSSANYPRSSTLPLH